jgi:hypothetical protein
LRRSQDSSDEEDSDDEHDRTLNRLHSHEEIKNVQDYGKHDALDRLVIQNSYDGQSNKSDSDTDIGDDIDSESSTDDGNCDISDSERKKSNFENDRRYDETPKFSENLSQTQTAFDDNDNSREDNKSKKKIKF